MARAVGKLTAMAVDKAKTPGMLSDGGGLYLRVESKASKGWIFRFTRRGTKSKRDMGLGPFHTVSLAKAREMAAEARGLLLDGSDPIEHRKAKVAAARLAEASNKTFKACALACIDAKRPEWKNAKHAAQWPATLEAYAYPLIGNTPVQLVDTDAVMRVLVQPLKDSDDQPLWNTRPETASRLRGRIETVLNWATVKGSRQGENPARWRGHLSELLPRRSKIRKTKHHAALPYSELGAFMAALKEQEGIASLALQFTILTAARTGETIGATRSEIDTANKVWIIPAGRMKREREHRVPLSADALAVVEAVRALDKVYLFSGRRAQHPMSNMAMLLLLRRMNRADLTVHGFRSTFRSWVGEATAFPREVAEMALAHVTGDKTEQSYMRGDLFQKRRAMMEAWSKYAATTKPSGEVVSIRHPRATND